MIIKQKDKTSCYYCKGKLRIGMRVDMVIAARDRQGLFLPLLAHKTGKCPKAEA